MENLKKLFVAFSFVGAAALVGIFACHVDHTHWAWSAYTLAWAVFLVFFGLDILVDILKED